MANLFLGMLQGLGVPVSAFGDDSNGALALG
jgi:hypothetical protein